MIYPLSRVLLFLRELRAHNDKPGATVAPKPITPYRVPPGGRLIPGVPVDDKDGVPHIIYDIEDKP